MVSMFFITQAVSLASNSRKTAKTRSILLSINLNFNLGGLADRANDLSSRLIVAGGGGAGPHWNGKGGDGGLAVGGTGDNSSVFNTNGKGGGGGGSGAGTYSNGNLYPEGGGGGGGSSYTGGVTNASGAAGVNGSAAAYNWAKGKVKITVLP